ncbi:MULTISPECIES: 2-oxoacid:acceptor oxidoreductase family protein [unclassified Nitrospina]|uniref:2-oxoacid:acceptor oxidoreductase family protein n=1 Tax=unclassified Nitrospina TaxID=2638683 RepID=UPI003F9B821B
MSEEQIMKRMNIRISGLGGQGAVTAAHLLAMAANKMGKYSISNPFFGAEKRMAPAESYVRIGPVKIYDRGELVFPEVIMVFHPQVITMQKSYTAPFYSGIKENGLIIINTNVDLLTDEDHKRLEDLNVSVLNHDATHMALDVGGTELSTNMAMIGACAGITKVVDLPALEAALQDRFGKRYVASGGTATLDEAIKKKYAKKEQLLQKNNDTIKKSYEIASEWVKTSNYSPAFYAPGEFEAVGAAAAS